MLIGEFILNKTRAGYPVQGTRCYR